MRPDEHKKRKNNQYKKKHGISSIDDKRESDVKKLSNVKASKGKVDKPTEVDKESKGKVKDVAVNLEDNCDDLKKRKLASNWSRYDDSSDDNDEAVPTQRGEHFNKLLTQAGGSAAQFRLKDEEDWSEAFPAGDSALSFDLENLAESLSCVQVHERLGIDKSLLTEEQVDEIIAVAFNNEKTYQLKYPKYSNDFTNENKDSLQSNNDNNNMKIESYTPNIHRVVAQIGNSASDSCKKNSVNIKGNRTDNVNEQNLNKNLTLTDIPETPSESKNKEILSLEDDLDMLLSLDESKIISRNTEAVNLMKSSKDTDRAKKTDKEAPSSGSVADTADLEDWLDSMLDE